MDRYRRWMDSELARRKRMEASVFRCLHSLMIIYKIATNRSEVIVGVRYYECNRLSGSWAFRSVGRSHLKRPGLLAYMHMLGGWAGFIIIAKEFELGFILAQRHFVEYLGLPRVVPPFQPISHCCDLSLYKGSNFATAVQAWYCPVTCARCRYEASQDAAGSLRVWPVYLFKADMFYKCYLWNSHDFHDSVSHFGDQFADQSISHSGISPYHQSVM